MSPVDLFQRLGLPRRYQIDQTVLEREYLTRSRAVHPDFHAADSTLSETASRDYSALLNEAYTILKDPYTRAEHLLALEGGPSAADYKTVPPSFLAEMLDTREAIEFARGDQARAYQLEKECEHRQQELLSKVAQLFDQLPQQASDAASRASILLEIRSLLNAVKFVQGLLRDLQTTVGPH